MKRKLLFVLFSIIVVYIVLGFINVLEVNEYSIKSSRLPENFDGFCIVQLSDLHCKSFGNNQSKLINKILEAEPDVVVLCGDFIDGEHDDISNVEHLVSGIVDYCDVFQVNGNHEKDNKDNYEELLFIYEKYGVNDLNDRYYYIERDNQFIMLSGADYYSDYEMRNGTYINFEQDCYSIFTYHNAALFDITSTLGYDLVLSGHTHGGIIRLPFIGGLINNNGSFGAVYDNGLYEKNNTVLISNRGLGDTEVPRFYNDSEIVKIILRTE